MSDVRSERASAGFSVEQVMIAVVAVLLVLAVWYVLSQREQSLRSSVKGFDGLQLWLTSKDVSSQIVTGRQRLDVNKIKLLVYPVYDTVLGQKKSEPKEEQEILFQQDEVDRFQYEIVNKMRRVPTLIILPKWRQGMRLTKKAHPVLLVESQRVDRLISRLVDMKELKFQSSNAGFEDFTYQDGDGKNHTARLYAPQTLSGTGCRPIVGDETAMVLAQCRVAGDGDHKVFVLSDPDLMNNHGLRLGDNAQIAYSFFQSQTGEGNIVIDNSKVLFLYDGDVKPKRERNWSDLLRFFGPPFFALWLGGAFLMFFLVWRGAVRYGPLKTEVVASGAKKEVAIDVRARLMRLSGKDGAMLGEYARARLAAVAAALIGPSQSQHFSGEAGFMRWLKRRHPNHADQLGASVSELHNVPTQIAAADAIRRVDEFENRLEQLTDDT